MPVGVHSEVGQLRTVMLHRPGDELRRLTPRNNDALLFDGLPWVERAQDEHDAFAAALRSRGVEVLYLTDLLVEALAAEDARFAAIDHLIASPRLGDSLRGYLSSALADFDAAGLAHVVTAGIRNDELRGAPPSIVSSLLADDEFLIDPLPNLLFTRDSSVWVGDHVALTNFAMPARRPESLVTRLIYTYHPRFASTVRLESSAYVEGGDVLHLGGGAVAVGVGERTTPAGFEHFARQVFAEGLATSLLAVPIAQERATMHLDTVVTMVDVDAAVMYPNVRGSLSAYTVTAGDSGAAGSNAAGSNGAGSDGAAVSLAISKAEPFEIAAARAMGIDTLTIIDTGLDAVTAEREQWDDGNNTLAIAPRVAVAYERNERTNERLADYGIEVVAISGSELGSGRGGPRCMSCPITRD